MKNMREEGKNEERFFHTFNNLYFILYIIMIVDIDQLEFIWIYSELERDREQGSMCELYSRVYELFVLNWLSHNIT